MKRAASILASIAFVFLLLQTMLCLLAAAIGLAVYLYRDPSNVDARQAALVFTIIMFVIAVLSLVGFLLVIFGRASILNKGKHGPTMLIVGGAISICPFPLIAGIFYRCLKPEEPLNQ